MPKSLSHDEVRNTVQSLIGPGFKVIMSRSEAEHISKLTGQDFVRALLNSVLYNLGAHNAPQEKIHLYKKRIDEIDKDLATKENAKKEMKYKYSWDETDKELWDKPEDCKICKDGWMIDYNGVSKYPCHCVKGQEKKIKVTTVDKFIESNKVTYINTNTNTNTITDTINGNLVPVDSYMYKKYYEQEQVVNNNWSAIITGNTGYTGASTNTQEKEKHEHLHEVIKITPEPKGRRFRKPVSP
jgi:hypothetical protein